MCQTQTITKSIGKIGRQSYDRRIRLASPSFMDKKGEIEKLLNEVDRLSCRLHDSFSMISEEDYREFGPELKIVIETLKSLRKESLSRTELKAYNNRMRQQIEDLEELDHDFKTFRIDAPKNKSLSMAMLAVGKLNLAKYAE